jgi:hypothetical protein
MTYFPLLNKQFTSSEIQAVDLSHASIVIRESSPEGTYEQLDAYINDQRQQKNAKVLHGGYLEIRNLYQNSPHFSNPSKNRNIHLGWDIWAPEYTNLYAPLPLRVHSFAYNNQILDYGATIVFSCTLQDTPSYLLMGHLSLKSIENLTVGQHFDAGDIVAQLGPKAENGGWPPHLHLQWILDMNGYFGDYPGVCSMDEIEFQKSNCPDPAFLPLVGTTE